MKKQTIFKSSVFCLFLIHFGLLIVGIQGCQALTPKQELSVAQMAFEGTVVILTQLKEDGQISPEVEVTIGKLIHKGQDFLNEWTEYTLETKKRPDEIMKFYDLLEDLNEWKEKLSG